MNTSRKKIRSAGTSLIVARAAVFACAAALSMTFLDPSRIPLLPFLPEGATLTGPESRGARAQAPGIEFFIRTRLAGNPSADIGMLWRKTWVELQSGIIYKRCDDPVWRSIGPSNIAGRVRSLAFDPADPAVIYAGSATGGVFGSEDEGLTWEPLMDDAPSLSIGALAVDRNDPRTIIAGTGEATAPLSRAVAAPVFAGIGLLKSVDRGNSWRALNWPLRSSAISRIALHPASSDTMLVASRDGLWKTTNGGSSWTGVLQGVVTDVLYHERDPSRVFAAIGGDYGDARNGVYRSDAGGRTFTWTKLPENFPAPDSTGRILLASTPADADLIFAMAARQITDDNFRALLRSSNGGDSWERVGAGLPHDFPLGQAFYNFCISVSPVDPDLVYVGGIEIHRSTDRGNTFRKMTFAGQTIHVDQHAVAFQPGSDAVFVANDGGVYKSDDRGLAWSKRDSALPTVQFYTITAHPSRPGILYGGTQDNGTMVSSASAQTWRLTRGDVDGGAVQTDGDNIYSMATVSIFPARSTDDGLRWSAMYEGLGGGNRRNWLQPLLLHPADRNLLYTATQYVYAARDVASTSGPGAWRQISPDLTGASSQYESVISALAIAPSNPGCMYAASGDGRVHRTDDLLSESPSWIDVSAGLPNRWITDVAVHPMDHLTAVAACSGFGAGHVFKTGDGGASWADISGGLPDLPVNSVLFAPGNADVLFIATDAGVWTRTTGGSWIRYGHGLPNAVVYDLAVDAGNRLIAATHGRGAWMTEITVGSRPPSGAPAVSALDLSPLPFSISRHRRLTAVFESETPTDIEFTIFDVTGRPLRKSGTGGNQTGIRRHDLPVHGLAPGVYFVSASAPSFKKCAKALIVP